MIQLSTPINLDLLNFISYEFTDSSSVGLGGLRIQLFDEKQSMIDERQIPLNHDVSVKIEYKSNYWSLVTSLTNIDYNNPWTGTDLLGNPDPNIHFTLSDYYATNGQDLEIWFNIGLTKGEIVNKFYKGFDLSFALILFISTRLEFL